MDKAITVGFPGQGLPDTVQGGSNRPYQLGEVVITAAREPVPHNLGPAPVTVFTEADLSQLPSAGIPSFLRLTPGVAVRSYGGSSAVQTASIRGLPPENTVILVDGVRWNSPQNALADLSILTAVDPVRVEVARGALSAFTGPNAVGGIVHLISRPPPAVTTMELQAGAASAHATGLRLRLSGTTAGIGWSAAGSTETGRGDYAFRYEDGLRDTLLRRTGADFRLRSGSLRLSAGDSSSTEAHLLAVLTDAGRGSPGAVTSPASASGSRLDDRQASGLLTVKVPVGRDTEFRSRWGYLWTRQEYADPSIRIAGETLRSIHRTTFLTCAQEVSASAGPGLRVVAGGEVSRSGILSTEAAGEPRFQGSAFAGTVHRLSPGFVEDLQVYPSVRFDAITRAAPVLHPHLAVNVGLLADPAIRVRAAAGSSSRLPTFNEQFWQPGGNPSLLPERSLAFEAGLLVHMEAAGRLEAGLSAYNVTTRDRIVWLPGSGGIWSPRNLRDVRSRGVEAELSWTAGEQEARFSLTGALMEARRTSPDFPGDPTAGAFLPYSSRRAVSGRGTVPVGLFTLSATYAWTGERYADEANTRTLPAYGTADAAVRCTMEIFDAAVFLQADVFNLFDVAYEILPLYPMPLREFKFTIGVQR